MRFLVDESTGPAVARWLREQGYEVFSVYDEARGMSDSDIIQKAFIDKWVLITNDKDFGEFVYRQQSPHQGIILLRLKDERSACKIEVLQKLLQAHAQRIENNYLVVTETRVRFAG
jgi:predicted nuclease of predicted toxin-antitoxin system